MWPFHSSRKKLQNEVKRLREQNHRLLEENNALRLQSHVTANKYIEMEAKSEEIHIKYSLLLDVLELQKASLVDANTLIDEFIVIIKNYHNLFKN